ncbi:MAG: HAMP domain-containing histidine kinase [Clostridiales bacterium]|nr:HAMP domain-containing histidine kinase [Clostridiales bacterium]
MDTKSKNFKYSDFTKIVAVLLCFTLVFLAGHSAFSLYRSEIIFADGGKDNFTATPSFLYNIRNDIRVIAAYSSFNKNFINDKAVFAAKEYNTRTSIENLNADRERAIKIFDIIQKFKSFSPEKPESNAAYDDYDNNDGYYSYNNGVYGTIDTTSASLFQRFEFTSPYDNSVLIDNAVSTLWLSFYSPSNIDIKEVNSFLERKYSSYDMWYDDYQVLRSYIFNLVNDARSHSSINTEFDKKIESYINNNWDNYVGAYYSCQTHISLMTNIQFIVVNSKTKEVFSNVDENIDVFKSSITDSLFHINYSAKQGLISGGVPDKTTSSETIMDLFSSTFGVYDSRIFSNSYLEDYFGTEYDVYIMMPKELKQGDIYHYIYQNYNDIKQHHNTPGLTAILFFLLFSLLPAFYLIFAAGRKDENTVKLAFFDKMPFSIHFVLSSSVAAALLALIAILISFEFSNTFYDSSLYIVLSAVYRAVPSAVGIIFAAAYLIMLEMVLSFARLVKAKQLYRYSITYYIVKLSKNILRLIMFPFNKNLKRKFLWGIIFFLILDALLAFSVGAIMNEALIFTFFLWVVLNAAVFFAAIKFTSGLTVIAKAAEEMSAGNYDIPLDINSLPKSLRKTASDIMDIRGSIQNAVNEQLKGDRMKTELITNVSHDLKTPLTSIINYVDLLKKCNIEDEECKKHLEVLDEKSKRLKYLIEDLTEASKATTGNIKINEAPIDLSELAVQALGEHSDAFEAAGLNIVYEPGKEHPIIYADSQHTWRIIENLISNVKKYAQPETRVYMEVYTDYDYGVFSIKNVSKNPLNIPVSELTERFVRGDSSRTGEGSGLGLSIAQSLCELQKGRFILEIDGDLFKAKVKLPLYDSTLSE